MPQALTVSNASDLSSAFLMLSVLLSLAFQSAKRFTTWWCDWVAMPHSVSELKTDVGQLKTDVGQLKTDVGQLKTDVGQLKTDVEKLSWRTLWLAFLDK